MLFGIFILKISSDLTFIFFSVTAQLHESLILEYATTLMGHNSLWQCGASYLIHCPIQGLARLEILLQSLPMGSEARVNKIIDIARGSNMNHIGKLKFIFLCMF